MPYTSLPSRSVIKISGEDAVPFLQGLVTNDVTRLPAYACLLSPQGKFLHDFFMLADADAILVDIARERREDFIKRLSMYKLRSKVTIEAVDMPVHVVWGAETRNQKPEARVFLDPRYAELGYRIIGAFDTKTLQKATPDEYERHRLSLGVPDGRDMIPEKSFLLEFGIDQLHGVDFKKGCYVGQEVTARTKYRGQVKKFIYKIEADGALPEIGTPILLGDSEAGQLRTHIGTIGLAQLRIEHVQNAQKTGQDFHCGTVALKAALPQWVTSAPTLE